LLQIGIFPVISMRYLTERLGMCRLWFWVNRRAAMARVTKAELQAVCDDLAATFSKDYQTKGVDAMTKLIMDGLRSAEWMEKDQIKIAVGNIAGWYAKLEDFEREIYAHAYHYISQKLDRALHAPSWYERLL
jgi:hypothetical protein